MNAPASRTRDNQDAHFMELALRQSEIAVTRGQTPFGGAPKLAG